jgi:hypothetical protein
MWRRKGSPLSTSPEPNNQAAHRSDAAAFVTLRNEMTGYRVSEISTATAPPGPAGRLAPGTGKTAPRPRHRTSFEIPDQANSIFLFLGNCINRPDPDDPSCWVEAEEAANAWFGKFHIEPCRGISTESRDNGMMSRVQTSGGPLTIDVKTTSISVTRPYQKNIPPLSMTAGKTVVGWYETGSGTWWFAHP